MLRRALLGVLLLACALSSASAAKPHHRYALTLHDATPVRSGPSGHARVLAVLAQETQVELLSGKKAWSRVRIWGSVDGWVPRAELTTRRPWASTSTYHAPQVRYVIGPHPPTALTSFASALSYVRVNGRVLRPGAGLRVSAWKQDASARIWFRAGKTWLSADALRLDNPSFRTTRRDGHPVAWRVRGKGMWLTLGIAQSNPDAVAAAAVRDGLTHLYIESAISPLGFHGRSTVGPFIDAAHRHGLAVIAWVYPYLYDIARDVALTREVAAFRTTSGGRFDGIAADLETNVSPSTVRTYSELIRAYLGPRFLLVGVTYPPQSGAYPFGEVAAQYNVIAPMDYWHQTQTSYGPLYGHMRYGYSYGYQFAADSIAQIRSQVGAVPIAPIGQTFDDFGRLEMGPYTPSGSEVHGFLAGSKAAGALGVSFFQWMTAAGPQWNAIHDFQF